MKVHAAFFITSLADPPSTSVINAATNFLSSLLFGPLATAIAVIAIAWIGFAMLSGRTNVRHGLSVILGCFILFGAKTIADGLRKAARNGGAVVTANAPPPPTFVQPYPKKTDSTGYDPYAGAAVTRPEE